ncbi:MAG: helix-turn-helix domain-containing protein [Wujia sp.]
METMTIKEAAKKLGVEAHVLRYWEDELGLEIKRNSMGHRYYDDKDIEMFKKVQLLKEKGFALKDIKRGIELQKEKMSKELNAERTELSHGETDEAQCESGHKRSQDNSFENKGDVKTQDNSIQNTKDNSIQSIQESSEDKDKLKVVDFKQAQLQAVMNKIVANALRENKDIISESIKHEITTDVMRQFDTVMREKEEKEEARYRKLDEILRQMQHANDEVAVTRSKGLFKRKK